MPSPILARADALMQRRRQHAENDDVPVLTDAVDLTASDDDDLPLLLDIEPIEPLHPLAAPPSPPAHNAQSEAETILLDEPQLPELIEVAASPAEPPILPARVLREEIAREIVLRVEQRLALELPRIIEATVRDFLTEQSTAEHREADFKG
jgi:hypothetical protein